MSTAPPLSTDETLRAIQMLASVGEALAMSGVAYLVGEAKERGKWPDQVLRIEGALRTMVTALGDPTVRAAVAAAQGAQPTTAR